MAYKSIHTYYGLQKMGQAEAQGTTINLREMAVGDGNGNPATPDANQSNLVRERYRAIINRVYLADPVNHPRRYTAELIVPASIGGFTVREIGVFDAEGGLFIVGNVPDTYKPLASEGAFSDAVYRVVFEVTNEGLVNLQADPNVVVVTQSWILNNVTPAFLIPGGTTGQVLTKESNADGGFVWKDLDAVNLTVDCIEEKQILAAGQTQVDLALTTTRGLAVYIDGVRMLRGEEWEPDPVIPTRLSLAQAYPAGTVFAAAQNDPTGNADTPLAQAKNLADILDKPLARDNLGVYSRAEVDQRGRAPGDIGYTAASSPPPRCLKANGAAVSRTVYAALFAAIGTRYGFGDGFNTFNLPDGRGEFLRGWDDGRGVDTGRALGSGQGFQNAAHSHSGTAQSAGAHVHGGFDEAGMDIQGGGSSPTTRLNFGDNYPWQGAVRGLSAGAHSHTLYINSSGGTETRPRNLAMLCYIAF